MNLKSFKIGITALALAMMTVWSVKAQSLTNVNVTVTTNVEVQTGVDKAIAALGTMTNWAVEPYATWAPNAPKGSSKWGGGLFGAYDFNDYAGAGLGLDWLGQLSLVSGDLQLQAPFHLTDFLPASLSQSSFVQSIVVTPFVLGGAGVPYSGNGHFNGSPMVISDAGGYLQFGHFLGGRFDAGLAWGKWTGNGPYGGVTRYHAFAGMTWGF